MRTRRPYGGEPHAADMQHDVPRFTATLFLTSHLGGNWKWNEEYQEMTSHFSSGEVAHRLKDYLQNLSLASTVSDDRGIHSLRFAPSTYTALRKAIESGNALDLKGTPLKDSKKPLAEQIALELKQSSRDR